MWIVGSLGYRGLSALGYGQQGVETVVRAGVISFVVDVAVVDAGADERGLVHKHGAVASVVSRLTRCRVLGERANVTVKSSVDINSGEARILAQMSASRE